MSRVRVLDVGNCDPDHAAISQMLRRHFDVEIDRVMFPEAAIGLMRKTRYALVLVNRLIFADESDGLALHRLAKADPAISDQPIMMVSNFADAQQRSVAAGGVAGFGKSGLESETTARMLASFLPERPA